MLIRRFSAALSIVALVLGAYLAAPAGAAEEESPVDDHGEEKAEHGDEGHSDEGHGDEGHGDDGHGEGGHGGERVVLSADEARELAHEVTDDGGPGINPFVPIALVIGGLMVVAAGSKAALQPPAIDPHDDHH